MTINFLNTFTENLPANFDGVFDWRYFQPLHIAAWEAIKANGDGLTAICKQWFVHADTGTAGCRMPDAVLNQYMKRVKGTLKILR